MTAQVPAAGSQIATPSVDIDITFSEEVAGVDASDMELSGTAAGGNASVGTPTDLGGNTWRFPISGLVDGALNVDLAPGPDNIEDLAGNDLSPTAWSYTVSLPSISLSPDTFT